jgi:transposase-like protein
VPERLRDEVSADDTDMIHAATAQAIGAKRKTFLRRSRLCCRAVADSQEEAGEALFAFTRLHPSRGKSARATNTIERLQEECKRRITTQTVLTSGETTAMLFWVLFASGQITLRKVDRWQTIGQPTADRVVHLAA